MSNSKSLLTGKYIKAVLIPGEMSFITGYQWDFTEPASPVIWLHILYLTHLVEYKMCSQMTSEFRLLNEIIVWNIWWKPWYGQEKLCPLVLHHLQNQFSHCRRHNLHLVSPWWLFAVILLFFKGLDAGFRRFCFTTFPETKARLRVSKVLLFVLFEVILVSSLSTLRCTSSGPIMWLIWSL